MNYTTRSDKITTYRYKNYYIDTTNKIIIIIIKETQTSSSLTDYFHVSIPRPSQSQSGLYNHSPTPLPTPLLVPIRDHVTALQLAYLLSLCGKFTMFVHTVTNVEFKIPEYMASRTQFCGAPRQKSFRLTKSGQPQQNQDERDPYAYTRLYV